MNFSPEEDNLGLIFILYKILNSKKTFSLIEIKKSQTILELALPQCLYMMDEQKLNTCEIKCLNGTIGEAPELHGKQNVQMNIKHCTGGSNGSDGFFWRVSPQPPEKSPPKRMISLWAASQQGFPSFFETSSLTSN